MKHLFNIKNLLSILFIGCMSLMMSGSCTNDEDPLQFNEAIIGTWELENHDGEYITFYSTDIFVMNDVIIGNYDIEEEGDNEIWYYAADEEENEYEGFMYFSDIEYKKSIVVKGLPTHEDETIKIIYKQ